MRRCTLATSSNTVFSILTNCNIPGIVNDYPFDKAPSLPIATTDIDIPLQISGTNIFLETTTPAQLDTCTHIHLTCDAEWNPQAVNLSLS